LVREAAIGPNDGTLVIDARWSSKSLRIERITDGLINDWNVSRGDVGDIVIISNGDRLSVDVPDHRT